MVMVALGAALAVTVMLVVKALKTQQYKCHDPRVWGPIMWRYLHIMSLHFPDNPTPEQQQAYRNFMASLVHVLPCAGCKQNLSRHYEDMPVTDNVLRNKASFSRYVYDLHNAVNHELGKPSNVRFEDLEKLYC